MFPRSTMVREHLVHNHYPSVPVAFCDAAESAIDLCAQGLVDEPVSLPLGYGPDSAPAGEIVDQLHLESFVLAAQAEIN